MKRIAFCLAVLTTGLYAGDGKPGAPLGLYLKFQWEPSESARAMLEREVDSILAPLGFAARWREITDTRQEAWPTLAVLEFSGHCDGDGRTPARGFQSGALGWTHVSDGKILPFAGIDCDRIAAFVENGLDTEPVLFRARSFERAVARVVAHELYHVIAQTSEHGESGVARAEFTARELLSDNFHFAGNQAHVLRHRSEQSLLRMAASGSAAPPSAAVAAPLSAGILPH